MGREDENVMFYTKPKSLDLVEEQTIRGDL